MKSLACLALAALTLAVPTLSFGQTAATPVTRAEVRAELIRVEKAGYRPSADDEANYPSDIQAAEAKAAATERQQRGDDAVGGAPSGTSAASKHAHFPKPVPSACVGPTSFCNSDSGG
jgi:Domain of unknown function (DUF4148)